MNIRILARRGRAAAALAVPAVLACLIGGPPALAADAPFRAAPDIELGAGARTQPQPQAADVGDFDGDGRQDLAIADTGLDAVHIRIGKGDGTFEPRESFPGLADPRQVAVADFDGDGNEDLAVAAHRAKATDSVTVLRGKGDGSFAPHSSFALPGDAAAGSIAVGDFDADGLADLAVTSAAHVSVRRGQGDGRFVGGGWTCRSPTPGPRPPRPRTSTATGVTTSRSRSRRAARSACCGVAAISASTRYSARRCRTTP